MSDKTDPAVMPEVTFSTFVLSLASSALVHLGEVPNPETGSIARNEVLALNEDSQVLYYGVGTYFSAAFSTASIVKVGQPMGVFYGYLTDGYFQNEQEVLAAPVQVEDGNNPGQNLFNKTSGVYVGDIRFKDLNQDGVIDANDQTVIGDPNPDFTFGWTNTFTYKNFDLSFFIYARWGQMMNYEQMIGIYDPTGVRYTFPTYFSYYDKTIQADQNVLFPAADASMTNFGDYDNSGDMNYVDGSFWKIKNLTLGYTLPKNWCNKIGISNLRVYGTVTNLFVFSPSDYVKDYDPEMDGSLNFPLSRELVFGVNLTF